ncbi:MAG TPA: FecR domain-containing protein [Candidatus Acidoferrum sp.]|nr:FecR domain-containing protein [Candidatus Acidoferrum sp.]
MSLSCIRTIVGAALLGVGLLACLPARADELAAIDPQARTGAAGWRVDGITGEATAQRGAEAAAPVAVGQVLSPGSEIATGAGAVVFLSHNGDRLIVQPQSRMRIDAPGTDGLLDHFMQSLGSVFYDVEPRKNRSFGVSAPYVAAIVKGTRFLVTVAPDRNSVRVDRGRVLVESKDGASSILVDAGMVATAVPALARGVTLSSSGIPDAAAVPAAESLATTETGNPATGTADKATDTVGGVVSGASGAVGKVASGTANTVAGAASAVGNAVSDTVSAVGDTVSSTTSAAGNLVGGTVSGVTNAVGGVTNAVGGALGGLLGGKS